MDRTQAVLSPYYGKTKLDICRPAYISGEYLDTVSLADLLINGFVSPPNTINKNLKLASLGFDPDEDLFDNPHFVFPYPDKGAASAEIRGTDEWVNTYHKMLCDAVRRSCEGMSSPWMLQSGGKDSSSLAIAVSEVHPDVVCITYLGGKEENEIASAREVAKKLKLRHEALICDAGRAWDRYVKMAGEMPLLTSDFALLSYTDLVTEIKIGGGDGVIDGLGSDVYFGTPVGMRQRVLNRLTFDFKLPISWSALPFIRKSFKACFALSTLQMGALERLFPGSRFSTEEANMIMGCDIADLSRKRLMIFKREADACATLDEMRAVSIAISEAAGALAKGMYTAQGCGLNVAYPFCDKVLRNWVYNDLPPPLRLNKKAGLGKVIVRDHISKYLGELPYVAKKGSFRFDPCRLASVRFDQVLECSEEIREVMPGAASWLKKNRRNFDNKYHASKFYLLAVVGPWLRSRI